ncbi:hypothetical protein FVE85_7108 [Porphyridium purpureum]|uniref:Uncharacterized protein n=1 Tax=Porphyridium purpureum TaxID=35688 RepID=A0A5J4Z9V0_PORPP|nr:hypothetical protein FVE85_7108 [Porphyridium purpureum]|eukprot:POR4938..scf295_1
MHNRCCRLPHAGTANRSERMAGVDTEWEEGLRRALQDGDLAQIMQWTELSMLHRQSIACETEKRRQALAHSQRKRLDTAAELREKLHAEAQYGFLAQKLAAYKPLHEHLLARMDGHKVDEQALESVTEQLQSEEAERAGAASYANARKEAVRDLEAQSRVLRAKLDQLRQMVIDVTKTLCAGSGNQGTPVDQDPFFGLAESLPSPLFGLSAVAFEYVRAVDALCKVSVERIEQGTFSEHKQYELHPVRLNIVVQDAQVPEELLYGSGNLSCGYDIASRAGPLEFSLAYAPALDVIVVVSNAMSCLTRLFPGDEGLLFPRLTQKDFLQADSHENFELGKFGDLKQTRLFCWAQALCFKHFLTPEQLYMAHQNHGSAPMTSSSMWKFPAANSLRFGGLMRRIRACLGTYRVLKHIMEMDIPRWKLSRVEASESDVGHDASGCAPWMRLEASFSPSSPKKGAFRARIVIPSSYPFTMPEWKVLTFPTDGDPRAIASGEDTTRDDFVYHLLLRSRDWYAHASHDARNMLLRKQLDLAAHLLAH